MNSISLHEYAALAGSRILRSALRRDGFARGEGTYEEFMDQLYDDVDELIFTMQAGRELRQNDTEDRLSADIVGGLKGHGYAASSDTKTGGHVDVSVRLGTYSWLAEAKKNGNFKEGYLQLHTRYVTPSGNFAHNHGGLIFYMVEEDNVKQRLEAWRAALTDDRHRCEDCTKNPLAFYSHHVLKGPGTTFKVRTMGVSLYHAPQDQSARTSAAKKATKTGAAKSKIATPKAPAKPKAPARKRGATH